MTIVWYNPDISMAYNTNTPPISAETLESNAKRWLANMRYGESGTIIQLQDDCEIYLPPIIYSPKTLKKHLGPFYRKYILGYIRLNEKAFLTTIKEEIMTLCQKRKLPIAQNAQQLPLDQILSKIARGGYDIGLFVSHTKNLFQVSRYGELYELEHLLRSNKNVSITLFSEIDITHPSYETLTDKCSSLFTNILYYPMYTEADAYQFITFNSRLWNMTLPYSTQQLLVQEFGRYLWLLRHAVRVLRNQPNATIEEIYNDFLMRKKIHVVWNKFTPKEKDLIKKSFVGALTPEDKTSHEFQYLKQILLLEENNNGIVVTIPALRLGIAAEQQTNRLTIHKDRFYYDDRDISTHFTPNETILLRVLFQAKSTIVPREQIAKSIWSSSWEERYSDWAIDRLVYRVRQKLTSLDMHPSTLKTHKRKGISLSFI